MGITKGTVFNPGVAQATGQGGASGDALLKSQNGADISDKARFRHNIGVDGMTLSGPRTVYPGVTHEFNLTGWSDFSIYQVSADAGTVDVKDGVIALHVPVDVTGNVTLTVTRNDAHYSFTLAVSPVYILPPQITSPADGATDIDFTPVLTVSGFACNQEGVDTYLKTQWEISVGPGYYTDEELATAVFEGHPRQEYNVVALRDSAEEKLDFAIPLSFGPEGEILNKLAKNNREEYTYTPAETRDYLVRRGATYRVRARHVGHMLVGGWSEYATFTISDHPIAKPVITYPAAGETGIDATAGVAASDFSLQHNAQDELSTSEWEIATDSAFVDVVWRGVESGTIVLLPDNIMRRSTVYYVRMRYKGKVMGHSDYSDVVNFTTAAHFLPTKEIAMMLEPYGDKGAHFEKPVFSHDGVWLFIGARGSRYYNGAVYAYKRDGQTWKWAQTITNPDSNGYFGTHLAFSCNSLFVASADNIHECILLGEQWQVSQLQPSRILSGVAAFRVSQDANTVVVGSYDSLSSQYIATILTRKDGAWVIKKIKPANKNLMFAQDVDISADGTVIAVGTTINSQGTIPEAYIYRLTGADWVLEKTFKFTGSNDSSMFGRSVALSPEADMLFTLGQHNRTWNEECSAYVTYLKDGEWKEKGPLPLPLIIGASAGNSTLKYSGNMLIHTARVNTRTSILFYGFDSENSRLILKAITATKSITGWMEGYVTALSDDKSSLALGVIDNTQGPDSNAVVIFTEGGMAE
ncbi:hypothetical protein E1610_15060 [Salmonella enterica subsp. enterica serovar Muenchen]|nr:hypothetical protein [Salmonella enterica subsp. enterica serovar Muenchen]